MSSRPTSPSDRENPARLATAIAFREKLDMKGTDAVRLVDGEGDGFHDLEIDDLAGRWLAQTRKIGFPEWLRDTGGWRVLYWKRLGEEKMEPMWIAGEKVEEPFIVKENGVSYWIDFHAGSSPGLFLDQRDNRAALRQAAAGSGRQRQAGAC